MGDRIKDFLLCSKYAFKESCRKLKKSYILLLFIIIQSMFSNIKLFGLSGAGYIGGIINYLIEVIILCFIVQSLKSIVLYNNVGKKSIENSIQNYFSLLLNTMFAVYIIDLMISILSRGLSLKASFLLNLLVRLLLSAVLELVYIEGTYGFSVINESIEFVSKNILTWGIYALIINLIEMLLTNKLGINAIGLLSETGSIILLSVCDTFFYLFKGHLFKYLSEHSYRQRKFMRG